MKLSSPSLALFFLASFPMETCLASAGFLVRFKEEGDEDNKKKDIFDQGNPASSLMRTQQNVAAIQGVKVLQTYKNLKNWMAIEAQNETTLDLVRQQDGVLEVVQDAQVHALTTTQSNPGWALD